MHAAVCCVVWSCVVMCHGHVNVLKHIIKHLEFCTLRYVT